MPVINAQARSHNNGDLVSEFMDVASPVLTTWSYPQKQNNITFWNMGSSNITLKIGTAAGQVVQPGQSLTVDIDFDKISAQSTSGTQAMRVRAIRRTKERPPQYTNSLSQAKRQMLEAPIFEKYPNNPIFKRDDAPWLKTAGYKLYWPWIVPNMKAILPDAFDNLYLYYSSDHASGAGGIGLATAPAPEGPWTDRGMIYVDTTFGIQTETPCVVWNPDTNLFHLYYQQQGVGRTQETCLATSPNGYNNWTLVKQGVIHVEDVDFPGDGHTGYAKVFRIGKQWYAQHLMGGGNFGRFGISYSWDGITWQTDPRPMSNFADFTEDSTYRKIESVSTPFKFRGELWTTYATSLLESGGVNTDRNVYVGPLRDLRKPIGLYPTVPPGATGTWDAGTISSAQVFEWDAKLYMIYQGKGLDGNAAFGLAIAEV